MLMRSINLPEGGKQTGLMILEKLTGLRSLRSAMSLLYESGSKLRWRTIAVTARMMAALSVVMVWSWSPRITRILDRFNLENGN